MNYGKLIVMFFGVLINSCSSFSNEDEHYKAIKKLIKENKPTHASSLIFDFENAYPESKKLCELFEIQSSILNEKGHQKASRFYFQRKIKSCK